MSETERLTWDARWSERGPLLAPPSPWLASVDYPARGSALDVAGGSGRHALMLASKGLDVTLTDISAVALNHAKLAAQHAELQLTTTCLDLDTEPLPSGPWDVIVCHYFLSRPVYAHFAQLLKPDGCVVIAHPTRRNLERNPRPSKRYLLDNHELPTLFPTLDIVHYDEGWHEGRHEAQLIAFNTSV